MRPFLAGILLVLLTPAFAGPDRAAEKALTDALKSANGAQIRDALLPIVRSGGSDGAKLLLKLLEKSERVSDLFYWQLCNAATSFSDAGAMEEVGDFLVKKKKSGLARDLLFALQNNSSTAAVAAHKRVLDRGADDMKRISVDQLAAIRSVASVDALISAYLDLKPSDALAQRIDLSLRILTGADCGAAEHWQKWWAGAREYGLPERQDRSGTGTVTDDLDPAREGEFAGLETLDPSKIVVLRVECKGGGCNFDHIERVLDRMNIPHTVMNRKDFEKDLSVLQNMMVLVINCVQIEDHCLCPTCKPDMSNPNMRLGRCTGCSVHDIVNHRLAGKTVKAIGAFVESGGFLFTEDWGLIETIEPNWSKFVKAAKMLGDREVSAQPARGMTSHPLLRGVFARSRYDKIQDPGGDEGTVLRDPLTEALEPPQHLWTVDDDSPAIRVNDPSRVVTLLRSDELFRDAAGADAVALTFSPRGRRGGDVLHVLSHFGKQGSQIDEFAMQNLLLNFLLRAQQRSGQ